MGFRFEGQGIPDGARVVGFRGQERISRPYLLDVFLSAPAEACRDLDLDALIGGRVTLTLEPPETEPAAVHSYRGVISDVEIIHAETGAALLGFTMVPALHALTLDRHSRMFTGQAIPDIIRDVIGEAELDSELSVETGEDHPVEEHVCQLGESRHDFLARWIEREGMHYFFDHAGDTEKLVITDSASSHDACRSEPVRYHPLSGEDVSTGEAIHGWRQLASQLPASVRINDYDHLAPSVPVTHTQSVSSLGSAAVLLHEQRTFSGGEAKRIAELRAQELAMDAVVYEGHGSVLGLRPGFIFELEAHPHGDLNDKYLVVAVEHEGAQNLGTGNFRRMTGIDTDDGYRVRIWAIKATVPFRSPCVTPWPRAPGYLLARVDGEVDGDYAQLDEHGRYQVSFMFDESTLADGKRSTRLRMLQPHAGAPEGWHFPLRKGTEVVVAFTGGDCDRPVIAGAVHNTENPSVVTKANHTQNVLQTGGLTRIEIEDQEGQQYFYNVTPPKNSYLHLGYPFDPPSHNVVLNTQGDNLLDIGANQDIWVGGELDEQVKKEVTETYKAKQTSTIKGKKDTNVGGAVKEYYKATQTTTVNGGVAEELYKNGQLSLVSGARKETYNNGQNTQVFKGVSEIWNGTFERKVTGATTETHNGALTELVDGTVTERYPASIKEVYGDTTWDWKSLMWITPSIQYTGPQLDIGEHNGLHFHGFYKEIDWKIIHFYPVKVMINVLFLEVYNVLIEAFPVKLDMTGFMRLDCPDEKIAGGAYVAPMALRDKITAMRKVV